jgi:two-component system CheB/CheR fusion protein
MHTLRATGLIAQGVAELSNSTARTLRRRILVVDDVSDAAYSLAMVCELYGAEAKVAGDGLEALRIAAEFRPEVVLMDITMPHMDGYEAARRIRAEEWGKAVILVALTGWGRRSDVEAARAAGFDGHLLKPVEAEALVTLVSELCSRQL